MTILRWFTVLAVVTQVTAGAAGQSDAGLADARAYLRVSDRLGTAGQITYDEVEATLSVARKEGLYRFDTRESMFKIFRG